MHHETGGGLHLEQPYWQRTSTVPNRQLAAARPRGTSLPSHSLVCEPEDPAAQITSVPHAMSTSYSFFFTRCKRKNGSSIQSKRVPATTPVLSIRIGDYTCTVPST
jgi:hypothetical protein